MLKCVLVNSSDISNVQKKVQISRLPIWTYDDLASHPIGVIVQVTIVQTGFTQPTCPVNYRPRLPELNFHVVARRTNEFRHALSQSRNPSILKRFGPRDHLDNPCH